MTKHETRALRLSSGRTEMMKNRTTQRHPKSAQAPAFLSWLWRRSTGRGFIEDDLLGCVRSEDRHAPGGRMIQASRSRLATFDSTPFLA